VGDEPDEHRLGRIPSQDPTFDDLQRFLQWLAVQPFWLSEQGRYEQQSKPEPLKGGELTIPSPSSRRSEDYYEVRLHFNRKVIAVLVFVFLTLSRLFETLGYDLIRSFF